MDLESLALGHWVETRTEPRRGDRVFTVAVNRRTRSAIQLDGVPQSELGVVLADGGYLAGATPPPPPPRAGWIRRFARTLDAQWTGVDRLVRAIYRSVVWRAWTRGWMVAQAAIGCCGLVAVIAAFTSGRHLALRPEHDEIVGYIVLSLVAIAIHELGHAVVLTRNGRRVDALGFRLHLGSPAFYVESVDALLMPRRQRLIHAAAGPWAEWQIVSIVAIALWAAPGLVWEPVAHRFVVLTAITVLMNLLPFSGLDGSHILGDLIREPMLARESQEAVIRRLNGESRPGDRLLTAYAVANTVVSGLLLLSSLALWYVVFGGAVTALARHGLLGVLAAAAVLVGSFGPMVAHGASTLRAFVVVDRIAFRLERRARVRFTQALARVAPFDRLDDYGLSVIAGQLELHRVAPGQPIFKPCFSGFVAVEHPARINGRRSSNEVHRLDGMGLAVTARSRTRSTRVALLPERCLDLLRRNGAVDLVGATP